jgi:hypothetical protein
MGGRAGYPDDARTLLRVGHSDVPSERGPAPIAKDGCGEEMVSYTRVRVA